MRTAWSPVPVSASHPSCQTTRIGHHGTLTEPCWVGDLVPCRRLSPPTPSSPPLLLEQPAVYGREHAVAWQQQRRTHRVGTSVTARAATHWPGPARTGALVGTGTGAT